MIKKRTKFCKQQKIGGLQYFGDSDVVNKLIDLDFTLFFSNLVIFSYLGSHISVKDCLKIVREQEDSVSKPLLDVLRFRGRTAQTLA